MPSQALHVSPAGLLQMIRADAAALLLEPLDEPEAADTRRRDSPHER